MLVRNNSSRQYKFLPSVRDNNITLFMKNRILLATVCVVRIFEFASFSRISVFTARRLLSCSLSRNLQNFPIHCAAVVFASYSATFNIARLFQCVRRDRIRIHEQKLVRNFERHAVHLFSAGDVSYKTHIREL